MSNDEAMPGDPTPAGEPLTEVPTRRGRGPTRPTVRAADWAEDVLESRVGRLVRAEIVCGLPGRLEPNYHRGLADLREAELERHVQDQRAAIRELRAVAGFIARYAELPPPAQKIAAGLLEVAWADDQKKSPEHAS